MRKVLHGLVLALLMMVALPFAVHADETTPYPAPPVTASEPPTQVAGSSLPLTTAPAPATCDESTGPGAADPNNADAAGQNGDSTDCNSAAVATTASLEAAPQQPPAPQPAAAQDLAWTGSGLNVGMTLGIAGAIVLLGALLVLFGSRGLRRNH